MSTSHESTVNHLALSSQHFSRSINMRLAVRRSIEWLLSLVVVLHVVGCSSPPSSPPQANTWPLESKRAGFWPSRSRSRAQKAAEVAPPFAGPKNETVLPEESRPTSPSSRGGFFRRSRSRLPTQHNSVNPSDDVKSPSRDQAQIKPTSPVITSNDQQPAESNVQGETEAVSVSPGRDVTEKPSPPRQNLFKRSYSRVPAPVPVPVVRQASQADGPKRPGPAPLSSAELRSEGYTSQSVGRSYADDDSDDFVPSPAARRWTSVDRTASLYDYDGMWKAQFTVKDVREWLYDDHYINMRFAVVDPQTLKFAFNDSKVLWEAKLNRPFLLPNQVEAVTFTLDGKYLCIDHRMVYRNPKHNVENRWKFYFKKADDGTLRFYTQMKSGLHKHYVGQYA